MYVFFFFNDTATTEIYTLPLHDALPISRPPQQVARPPTLLPVRRRRRQPLLYLAVLGCLRQPARQRAPVAQQRLMRRSEEHTSELQSRQYLVCRLLLEKKKKGTRRAAPL